MLPSVSTPSTSDKINSTRRQRSFRFDMASGSRTTEFRSQGSGARRRMHSKMLSASTLDFGPWTLDCVVGRQPDDVCNINQPHRPPRLIDDRQFADFTPREQV